MSLVTLLQETPYEARSFIQTSSGNVISRKASIYKPQALEIPGGKVFVGDGVHIRADISAVQLQKYVYIDEDCIIRPGYVVSPQLKFIPVTIGSHTYIGKATIVEAACIGIGCHIGKNCILSARSILKDYVQVQDGTIIPPDMVVPPFAIVGGCPARILAFRPESAAALSQAEAMDRQSSLKPIK